MSIACEQWDEDWGRCGRCSHCLAEDAAMGAAKADGIEDRLEALERRVDDLIRDLNQ